MAFPKRRLALSKGHPHVVVIESNDITRQPLPTTLESLASEPHDGFVYASGHRDVMTAAEPLHATAITRFEFAHGYS